MKDDNMNNGYVVCQIFFVAIAALFLGACGSDSGGAAVGGGDGCTLSVVSGDSFAYAPSSISVSSNCSEVTVNFRHIGQMPVTEMGHNWVLIAESDLGAVVSDGARAGIDAGYLAPGDDRVIAATGMLGGGQSDTVTFSLDALEDGREYIYVCTFPGHWAIMIGTFTVT